MTLPTKDVDVDVDVDVDEDVPQELNIEPRIFAAIIFLIQRKNTGPNL